MSNVMGLGILLVAYTAFLLLGLKYHWALPYVDWESPYFHYAVVEAKNATTIFFIPALMALWMAFSWYRKSMIGEA